MKRISAALILSLSLLLIPTSPATAHYDDWHQATCQQPGTNSRWYRWPSAYTGTRVTYWKAYTIDYVNVDVQFLQYDGETGYECGWLKEVRTHAWIQQVCEFGYCGQGTIQAFQNGQIVRHFGGYAAGWVAAYSY